MQKAPHHYAGCPCITRASFLTSGQLISMLHSTHDFIPLPCNMTCPQLPGRRLWTLYGGAGILPPANRISLFDSALSESMVPCSFKLCLLGYWWGQISFLRQENKLVSLVVKLSVLTLLYHSIINDKSLRARAFSYSRLHLQNVARSREEPWCLWALCFSLPHSHTKFLLFCFGKYVRCFWLNWLSWVCVQEGTVAECFTYGLWGHTDWEPCPRLSPWLRRLFYCLSRWFRLSQAEPLIQEALPSSLRLSFLTSKNSSGGLLTFSGCCAGSQGQEWLLLKGRACLLSCCACHGDGSHGRSRGWEVEPRWVGLWGDREEQF